MKTSFGIKVDPRDEKYVLTDIPKGFDPENNKRVVEETIRKADVLRQRKWVEWEDDTRERANALASYFKYLDRGGSSPTEKYFGRKYQAYLRGQILVDKLKDHYVTVNRQGQTINHKT